jgi:hypothetical protein
VIALACGNALPADAVRGLARLARLGRRCPARPALRAFPSPATLARIDGRGLRESTGLGPGVARVRRLAREETSGRRDLQTIDGPLRRPSGARAEPRARTRRGRRGPSAAPPRPSRPCGARPCGARVRPTRARRRRRAARPLAPRASAVARPRPLVRAAARGAAQDGAAAGAP